MTTSIRRARAAAVAVLLGSAVGGIAAAAPASAHPRWTDPGPQHVVITATGTGATASISRTHLHPGTATFTVVNPTANSVDTSIASITNGSSITKVLADVAAETNGAPPDAAAATRALNAEIDAVGGVDVSAGQSAAATVHLGRPCTYYVINADTDTLLATLSISGHQVSSDDPDARATIVTGEGSNDVFRAPEWLPAHGTVRIVNRGDSIHFVDISPVAPGTTDAAIQAEFDQILAGQQPTSDPAGLSNANAITAGEAVLSPGNSAKLTYDLPAGTYVLLCFIADDTTGIPHAFMGMHLVVHLG